VVTFVWRNQTLKDPIRGVLLYIPGAGCNQVAALLSLSKPFRLHPWAHAPCVSASLERSPAFTGGRRGSRGERAIASETPRQRATKGFSGAEQPKIRSLIRRNPIMSLRYFLP